MARITKNGHYDNCLMHAFDLITDINVKCRCGRPLPLTLGCAIGRVYCAKCYSEKCEFHGYNKNFSLCLNKRLDAFDIEYEDR